MGQYRELSSEIGYANQLMLVSVPSSRIPRVKRLAVLCDADRVVLVFQRLAELNPSLEVAREALADLVGILDRATLMHEGRHMT
jgi:hypothetical protein